MCYKPERMKLIQYLCHGAEVSNVQMNGQPFHLQDQLDGKDQKTSHL